MNKRQRKKQAQKQAIKVLEYTVNLTDNTVSISLGNSIFREVMPKIYRFK